MYPSRSLSLRNQTGAEAETLEARALLAGLLPGSPCYFSYTSQDRLPTHSKPGPPTPTNNQENAPQTCPQAKSAGGNSSSRVFPTGDFSLYQVDRTSIEGDRRAPGSQRGRLGVRGNSKDPATGTLYQSPIQRGLGAVAEGAP